MITGPSRGVTESGLQALSGFFVLSARVCGSPLEPRGSKRDEDGMTVNKPPLEPKEARALEEFVQRVRKRLGENLVALKLFGSKAAGRGEPDSDIDVLVTVNGAGAAVEDQVLDVAFEVNVAHEVYISPRVIARATLEDPVWRLTPFLQAVEREGVPL